jgi:hypothetical protein
MSAALGLSKLRGKERQCHWKKKKKRNDTTGHRGPNPLLRLLRGSPGMSSSLVRAGVDLGGGILRGA